MNEKYLIESLLATLKYYDPETATLEELKECYHRCLTGIESYMHPIES